MAKIVGYTGPQLRTPVYELDDGTRGTIQELCDNVNFSKAMVVHRVYKGMSLEKALKEPSKKSVIANMGEYEKIHAWHPMPTDPEKKVLWLERRFMYWYWTRVSSDSMPFTVRRNDKALIRKKKVYKHMYITFGQVHVHQIGDQYFDKDVVAKIPCTSYNQGVQRAYELFGNKWCASYSKLPKGIMKHFPRGVLELKEDSNDLCVDPRPGPSGIREESNRKIA